jgi:hypothetical protein
VFYESIGPDQMLVSAREVFARSSDYRGYDLQDPTPIVGLSLELSLLHQTLRQQQLLRQKYVFTDYHIFMCAFMIYRRLMPPNQHKAAEQCDNNSVS